MFTTKLLFILLFNLYFAIRIRTAPTETYLVEADSSKPVLTIEVPSGESVTLLCKSNDKNHTFFYWHLLDKNRIVGPGNEFDVAKYNYEVLSGNLTIRAVSENEEGLYNCVSRGILKNDINVRSVRMIVTRDWGVVYEQDTSVNLFRTLVVITTLIVLAGVAYIFYRIWKDKYRYPTYLMSSDEEEEDDSGEEIFRAPGTSRGAGNIVKSSDDFDSPGISTDFKSILDTVNNK